VRIYSLSKEAALSALGAVLARAQLRSADSLGSQVFASIAREQFPQEIRSGQSSRSTAGQAGENRNRSSLTGRNIKVGPFAGFLNVFPGDVIPIKSPMSLAFQTQFIIKFSNGGVVLMLVGQGERRGSPQWVLR
jgi:hypothetical protein